MRKSNILIIISSPRKNSNSTLAAIKLAEKISDKEYNIVNINNFFLKPCNSCFVCRKTLKCNIKDDFNKIMLFLNKAKIIIVAAPIYFTGVPGQLKIFIDRNQQQWEKYKRGFIKKSKTGYIILTSGSDSMRYFRPAESEIKSFFAVNGIKCKKIFRFCKMDKPRTINMQKYLKKIKI